MRQIYFFNVNAKDIREILTESKQVDLKKTPLFFNFFFGMC